MDVGSMLNASGVDSGAQSDEKGDEKRPAVPGTGNAAGGHEDGNSRAAQQQNIENLLRTRISEGNSVVVADGGQFLEQTSRADRGSVSGLTEDEASLPPMNDRSDLAEDRAIPSATPVYGSGAPAGRSQPTFSFGTLPSSRPEQRVEPADNLSFNWAEFVQQNTNPFLLGQRTGNPVLPFNLNGHTWPSTRRDQSRRIAFLETIPVAEPMDEDTRSLPADSQSQYSESQSVKSDGPATRGRSSARIIRPRASSMNSSTSLERNRTHVCAQCSSAFATPSQLARHRSTVHSQERNYPCRIGVGCKATFNRSDNRVAHERICGLRELEDGGSGT
jgi:hypothetical protein